MPTDVQFILARVALEEAVESAECSVDNNHRVLVFSQLDVIVVVHCAEGCVVEEVADSRVVWAVTYTILVEWHLQDLD